MSLHTLWAVKHFQEPKLKSVIKY